MLKRVAEEYRVSVRTTARCPEQLKERKKRRKSPDDAKHGHDCVQKITDDFIAGSIRSLKLKEEDVMAV